MNDPENFGMEKDPEHIEEAFRPAPPPEQLRPMKSIADFKPSAAPEEVRSMKSIGDFMAFGGKTAVKLVVTRHAPELGKAFEMESPIPMSSVPVLPPLPGVRGAKKVEMLGSCFSAKEKLAAINDRINRPSVKPPEEKTAEAPIGDPKPPISIERLVFLERVEKIMASEARIKEIEAENKTLVGMVTRLQKELDELKAKHAGKL